MTGFTYAQAAPGAFDMLNSLLIPTMLIIGIMYFLMIRPQQRRLKEHRDMVAGIRRGDTIVTSGGIIGKVTKVEDNELQVEIADNVRIKLLRSTVSEVRGKGEAAPAAKAKAAS
ncbi:preprotein translocase subunit YajC [Methyloceanibacter sp.]|jgi:preprotein translocase subunit YajC|uniref:preprotein translocase subunit YajC n=1 Tax=Methyloceanibacter sp. TaxID=1965321 RepID=UPI002C29EF60|nr:preprotein translocase subunit YajC [Methyloceanibacter sp.]